MAKLCPPGLCVLKASLFPFKTWGWKRGNESSSRMLRRPSIWLTDSYDVRNRSRECYGILLEFVLSFISLTVD